MEQKADTNENNEIPSFIEGVMQEDEEGDDDTINESCNTKEDKELDGPGGSKKDGPRLLGFWEITIMLAAVFSSGDIMIPW